MDLEFDAVEPHPAGARIDGHAVDLQSECQLGSDDGELVPRLRPVHRRSCVPSERLIVIRAPIERTQIVVLREKTGTSVQGSISDMKTDGISRKFIGAAVIDPDRRATVYRRWK